MDCSSLGSSVHEIFPSKDTGVGCHAHLQEIFLTQRSNPHFLCLLHCRWILYDRATREVSITICKCLCCFRSVTQSCLTLCDPMDCSIPDLPVPHHLSKFAQVHVHSIGDASQPSPPLMPSSPSALNLSQNQRLFQWINCSYQITKIPEFQLQHQSFQWIFRVDLP